LCVTAAVAVSWLTFSPARAARERSARPQPGAANRAAPGYAQVAPIFTRWCVGCHGSREQHGQLRLDGYAAILRGGDTGPAITPGDPESSLLLAKVEHRDKPVMPPRRRLPAALAVQLRVWIAAGAPEAPPPEAASAAGVVREATGRSRRPP
jgi:hypothetical protein